VDLPYGKPVPDFELPEPLTGASVRLSEAAKGAPATLVMWLCVHCPFVVHLKGVACAGAGVGYSACAARAEQRGPQNTACSAECAGALCRAVCRPCC
jgi:hypothetical protein